MLGRPLLADPYWPQKVREGRVREIIHCIGDQEGCIQSFILGGHPCCTVNPYTGFEDSKQLVKAKRVKNIAIVGAGPAGCEAAKTAHSRGHQVTLFEKTNSVGGQLLTGSRMKIKHDLALYINNLQYQMDLLEKEGVNIKYNTEVLVSDLKGQFDVIICCNGLTVPLPEIEGRDLIPHCEARELLDRYMQLPQDIKKVTVIGGGIVGCELSYSLAFEKQMQVSIVELHDDLMKGVVHANRSMLLWLMMGRGGPSSRPEDVLKTPVQAFTSSQPVRFESGRVILKANHKRKDPYTPWSTLVPDNIHNPFHKTLDPDDVEIIEIDTDYVVFATGGIANDGLYYELLRENAAPEIYCIGDSRRPARAWEAITSANEVARNI